ncbi:MAG TPA: DUF3341 domain-containing protein [Anaerolineae bacterium]|nr:DUF3341 domain-containing protein [Anaerolineae bacterium]
MSSSHSGPRLFGLMAEFSDPDELVAKTRKTREAGYRRIDAYSPFPIHGLSEAVGATWSWVPFIVLFAAISGGVGGYLLQWWTSAIAYPINIAGRPLNSWPAFMIIVFELAVLSSGVIGLVGMLALNKLPMPYHPVFNVPRFELASQDRFFLCVMTSDPKFDLQQTRAFLEGLEPEGVYEVEQDDDGKYD